jgi:hypothetical protein
MQTGDHSNSRRWGIALAALLLLGALAWLLRSPSAPPEPEPATRAPTPAAVEDRAPTPPSVAQPQPQPQPPTTTIDYTPDGVPIMPAGSAPVDATGMVPHPITPQHRRIFRENNLIGNLNGAMDVKDAAGLRRLLEQYRNEYPEDSHVLQDGYELIADCLERPGSETRAKAQRYYDEQLDSGLRRYIRRHCLEASNP